GLTSPMRLSGFAFAKSLASALAVLAVSPLVLFYRIAAAVAPGRTNGIFQGYSQLLSLLPGYSGSYLRRAFYRVTLERCPANCHIGFGTVFSTPDVRIGQHVYVGAFCMIGHCEIGDDVLIGSNVDILSGKRQHRFDRLDIPIRLQGGTYECVRIGRDAWLGNGSIIAADVGSQSIIAAGAVIVKPIGARLIMGGNPARLVARRTGADAEGNPVFTPPDLDIAATSELA
ncbi:MAG: acyltransferase, partial [Longimicrobiales bacterium]